MSVQWSEMYPRPSAEAWIEQIKKSVKDPKELEKLIWNSYEDFPLNAFYRKEDLENIQLPFLGRSSNKWEIRQMIYSDKIMAANQSALKALENGADSIYFKGSYIGEENEMAGLFKNIRLDWTSSHFDFGESNVAWLYLFTDYLDTNNYKTAEIRGSVNYDPLAELMISGNFDYNQAETEQIFGSVLNMTAQTLPHFKIVNVNAHHVREAGGNAGQELATALAMTVEYLEWAEKNKIDKKTVLKHLQFHLGIDQHYFIEIAKFRAFKILFARLLSAYGLEEKPCIHAINLERNKTIYDPYNNLIRATMEAMSAAIGGADAITIRAFDENYRQPDEFSYRLSRNIQLLLQEESNLDKVSDPAAGAYYLEQLTHKLAEQSWNLFLAIEKNGGYISSLKNKFLQQQIQLAAEKQNQDFLSGKLVSVGTNKYIRTTETKTGEFTKVLHPYLGKETQLVLPLKPYRLSEKMETERLKLETSHTQPKN